MQLLDLPQTAAIIPPVTRTVKPPHRLADLLKRALDDQVKLLALTIDERAIIPAALDDRRTGSPNSAPCS